MALDPSLMGPLRCFEVAGRLLNFTHTAQALHLTQSAVSQQIRQLEDRLGYRLFLRGKRTLSLTEKGVVLLECVSRSLGDIEKTLARLGAHPNPMQVSCIPSFALHWLMPRLMEFQREQPDVQLRVRAEFQALEGFAEGLDAQDVSIRFDTDEYTVAGSVVLMDEYMMAVASPEYLARNAAFASGMSLDGITMLHDAQPWAGATEFVEWRLWLEAVRPDWLPMLGGVQFNLSSLAIGTALNHQGVAMARTALVFDEIKSGRLVNVFDRLVPSPARYMFLCRDALESKTAVFGHWLQQECARFDATRREYLPI
jgi:LysR family glycine cleavage system transcriptional activator